MVKSADRQREIERRQRERRIGDRGQGITCAYAKTAYFNGKWEGSIYRRQRDRRYRLTDRQTDGLVTKDVG